MKSSLTFVLASIYLYTGKLNLFQGERGDRGIGLPGEPGPKGAPGPPGQVLNSDGTTITGPKGEKVKIVKLCTPYCNIVGPVQV